MEIFIGVIKEGDEVLFDHIANSSDDTIHVEIWDSKAINKPALVGEFRKWHHLRKVIEKHHPHLTCTQYNAGEVSGEWLINVLKRP